MADNVLHTLVNRALKEGHDELRRPVIQKELLHYDILFCLKQAGLLDGLVFQGGTSLRLCYGSNRYSEDLDFVGGSEYSSSALADMKSCIESYLGERYGLDVTVKEPATLRQLEPAYAALNVDRWQVSIITDPGRRNLPKQRVKIDVANIPAYTKTVRALQDNYRFLPSGYKSMEIPVESIDEIMADKLVALAASQKYVRYRDIWDLWWLRTKGATVQAELVQHKIEDYKVADYRANLEGIIEQIPSLTSSEFKGEMSRFLSPATYTSTLTNPLFEQQLASSLSDMYLELRGQLYAPPDEDSAYSSPTP